MKSPRHGLKRLIPMRGNQALRVHTIGDRGWHPSDIYHQLLRLTWPQVTAVFVIIFTCFNLFFAGLYCLDEDGIRAVDTLGGVSPFWRAFFFSIQTLATIGYGNLYPVSIYANVIVVVEITFGILLFAIVTGITFARFSRPTARVRFSKVAVVDIIDGTPTLMVRAANLRHNFVFEAQAHFAVLMDETVGETVLRRFHDLGLIRNSNPLFTLTWLIMHPIDETSPIASWMPGKGAPDDAQLMVVISGMDDRTGQTIHGRCTYSPSEVRWNARFADILGKLDDGTRTIDYRRFDDIEPIDRR